MSAASHTITFIFAKNPSMDHRNMIYLPNFYAIEKVLLFPYISFRSISNKHKDTQRLWELQDDFSSILLLVGIELHCRFCDISQT